MRWIEKKKFNCGDERVIRKFLWFPTRPVFECEWRWFEFACIEQEWHEGIVSNWWMNMRWKDED